VRNSRAIPGSRFFRYSRVSKINDESSLSQILKSHHLKIVEEERSLLLRLSDILHRIDASTDDVELIHDTILRIDEVFMVVIVGEFNAGKSTFLNSLLGNKYLRDGVLPTTDKINMIRYHGDRKTTIYSNSGGKPVLIEDFEDIYLPVPWLQHIMLVDTPGTNAIISRHELLTQHIVPRADLVLFVTSAERPLSESECLFLSKIREWGKKVTILTLLYELCLESLRT